ncbi:MAG: hypothetical protein ACLQI7_16245, partial [Streptosporangiaceae bacterium]
MSTSDGSPHAAAVYEGLLQSVPPAEGGRRAWRVADPYLLRHAAEHARDAGRVDELLQDPEFLIHGDPEVVNAVLATAKTPRGLLVAAVYRASYGAHRDLGPEQRRQILALDATRFQATDLARELARWADWQPVWATGEQVAAELITTLTGHTSFVTATAVTTLDGRPVAITTSWDRTARVWDLITGHTTVILRGHHDFVTGVATATLDGRPVAITTSKDRTARVWDLTTGRTVAILTGHTAEVTGVATTTLDGRPVAITTGFFILSRVWDLTTGQAIADRTGVVGG